MRTVRWTILLLILGILLVTAVSQGSQIRDVNISLTGNQIQVTPDEVTLNRGDRLRWRASGGDAGDRFEIDINAEGPFPSSGATDNPDRGRYVKNVKATIVTQPADASGRWKYTIRWIPANGAPLVLDPAIVVR